MLAIPLPLCAALFFAPESPYYLTRKGRLEQAVVAMDRLHAPHPTINSEHLVAQIQETFALEAKLQAGGGTYADCFRGVNRRRTEIAVISWTMPALVGYVVQVSESAEHRRARFPALTIARAGSKAVGQMLNNPPPSQFYATFFFTRAGIPTEQAFAMGLGNYCVAFVAGIVSWFLQYKFGRRNLILGGLVCMSPLMLLVGVLDFATSSAGRWTQSVMLIVWFALYVLFPYPFLNDSHLTLLLKQLRVMPWTDPLCHCRRGKSRNSFARVRRSPNSRQVPAIKLRAKTLALARMLYYAVLISASVLSPYFLQTWNLKGKAAFPAFGLTLLSLVWAFVRLPEMKG